MFRLPCPSLAAFCSRAVHATAALALGIGLIAPAAAQTAAAPVKVRYEEVVRSVLYLPAYVAISQGFFREAGLDVSMKTSQGTDKGMAALLSGSADVVLIGPEASVYVANSESPVKPKIFSGLTATDGFLLVAREKPAGVGTSFPGVGEDGAGDIAVALFTFADEVAYLRYRSDVAADPDGIAANALYADDPPFVSYERVFLQPLARGR